MELYNFTSMLIIDQVILASLLPSIDPAHAILALLVFFVGEQGKALTVLLR
jgi:hypothetical protein